MSDSVSVFAEHAAHYDAQRRRLVPSFELFYGTAVDMLALRGGEIRRVLDLGAGTGLMSQAVIDRYPAVELVLLDGADEMLSYARERLPPEAITTITRDMRAELPAGPFDAVVSGLAIHHLEHPDKRDLFARIHSVLRPGGAFVNAEHVSGPTAWLDGVYRSTWREACMAKDASPDEVTHAVQRMEMDRSSDVATQLQWMTDAGFEDPDCFFKHLHFAVLAGWRSDGAGRHG
ncbi:MAG TPA: methyltransferase domain-containing protein [Solirubrobacteraceae bacterium]|nr:methyltransferase domain-containing protein [Solirubrobacteraceae bacterium]